jgi:hypothetical protein
MREKDGAVEYNKKYQPAVPVFGDNQLKDQGYDQVILKFYSERPIYIIKPFAAGKSVQISEVGGDINPIEMEGCAPVIGR